MTLCACQRPPLGVATPRAVNSVAICREASALHFGEEGASYQPSILSRYILIFDISRYIWQIIGNQQKRVLVKHHHRHGSGRHTIKSDNLGERRGEGRHHRKGRRFGARGGRPFNYGEFRLLALAMISDEPRHGYELMKVVEDRMGGSYIPSPGVTYPTLSWLEDMGYTSADADQAGRKRYCITPQGKAFLAANQPAIDELLSRIGKGGAGRFGGVPAPILRGMENLKLALRLRMRGEPFNQSTVESIAAALDAAAYAVERS